MAASFGIVCGASSTAGCLGLLLRLQSFADRLPQHRVHSIAPLLHADVRERRGVPGWTNHWPSHSRSHGWINGALQSENTALENKYYDEFYKVHRVSFDIWRGNAVVFNAGLGG